MGLMMGIISSTTKSLVTLSTFLRFNHLSNLSHIRQNSLLGKKRKRSNSRLYLIRFSARFTSKMSNIKIHQDIDNILIVKCIVGYLETYPGTRFIPNFKFLDLTEVLLLLKKLTFSHRRDKVSISNFNPEIFKSSCLLNWIE